MAKLIYSAITSLDGYVADEDGKFDWSMPDAEVMRFLNEIERPVGTYLYGRGMYEVMAGWETASTRENRSPTLQDFTQLWQAADKVVYSRTLEKVSTSKTRLEREFDPDAVLGDGDRSDGEFVVVEGCPVDRAALVGDQDVGVAWHEQLGDWASAGRDGRGGTLPRCTDAFRPD